MTKQADHAVAFQRRRVLIVDDHADSAQSMAIVLRALGHEAEHAVNGLKALEMAPHLRPHVVFVDMELPDFHGSDLSRLLRIQCLPRKIRVVAITGYGEEQRERALKGGCDEFVTKPLDWKDIAPLLG